MSYRVTKGGPRGRVWAAGVAAVLAAAGPANAFYWRNMPGSGVPPVPTLMTTTTTAVPVGNTQSPPTDGTPPATTPVVTPPPVIVPDPVPVLNTTPEPSTMVAGLVGLAVTGVARWRRARKAA